MTDAERNNLLAAERAVIGCVLLDPARVYEAGVAPEDFFSPDCREIWSVIAGICNAGERPDAITISNACERPVMTMLVEIARETATAAPIAHYGRIVREASLERQCRAALERAANDRNVFGSARIGSAIETLSKLGRPDDSGVLIRDIISDVYRTIEQVASGSLVLRLRSGLEALDAAVHGFPLGLLSLLGARPSAGKSSLLATIAVNVATSGRNVDVYSLEDSRRSLVIRMLAQHARVSVIGIQEGKLSAAEWTRVHEAAGWLTANAGHVLVSDDLPREFGRLESVIRGNATRRNTALIIVDYFQLLGDPGRGRSSRNDELADVSRGLVRIAKATGAAMIVASQLTREAETSGRLRNHQLRDTGALEQDANVIVMLQALTDEPDDDPPPARLATVTKNKDAEANVRVVLAWEKSCVRFHDADRLLRQETEQWVRAQRQRAAPANNGEGRKWPGPSSRVTSPGFNWHRDRGED